MPFRLIVVPYLLGVEGESMGAGPLALQDPLAEVLRPDRVERVRLEDPPFTEVGRCFALNRLVAAAVAEAQIDGVTPVVLTGNCHTQQAVVAGLGIGELGLVWFDCHADYHTPETTESGFFDAFALSMITGDCWAYLCGTVFAHEPLPQERIVLCGVRDIDAGERARLDASAIREVAATEIALPRARRFSVHVDLDVLDPAVARANAFATPGGLTVEQLVEAVAAARPLAALTFSAYDPAVDPEGAVIDAVIAVAKAL